MSEPQPQLQMRLDSFDSLPPLTLPEGVTMTKAEPKDAEAFAGLMALCYEDSTWDAARIHREFLDHPSVTVSFLLWRGDELLATASCANHKLYPGWGYLHYVAALPDSGIKGLGLQATLATLHEFKSAGLERSVLETDDFRLPAIATYLKLGYKPFMNYESHEARWEALKPQLQRFFK